MTRYYQDEFVTLHHGDMRDDPVTWITADVLFTDPPYGRNWKQNEMKLGLSDKHSGIAGDKNTEIRDAALRIWRTGGHLYRPAVVFGDLLIPPPAHTKLVSVYRKPNNAGHRGAIAGHRRDLEAIYWLGRWPAGLGGRTSLYPTAARSQGNPASEQGRYDHPHAKPIDVCEALAQQIANNWQPATAPTRYPDIADPFTGSGSLLVACRNLGLTAIGWEIEEAHCETAARRLEQMPLPLGLPAIITEPLL